MIRRGTGGGVHKKLAGGFSTLPSLLELFWNSFTCRELL
jgi:hypothetical protein